MAKLEIIRSFFTASNIPSSQSATLSLAVRWISVQFPFHVKSTYISLSSLQFEAAPCVTKKG